jgi:ribosome-associated protein
MLEISPRLSIPEAELVERFVRSGGPGGQNVNKVATAVELRFDAARSPSLPEAVRTRLLARRDRRLTAEGEIVISAQRFRSQERNREDARARLAAMIATVLVAPKRRIATEPSRGSKERRLSSKRERAQIKRARTARAWERDA